MKIKYIYLRKILEIDGKSVKVNAMELADNGKLKWPIKEDIHEYPICD